MIDTIKQKLAWLGLAILGIAGTVLGLKLRRLGQLEAESRARDLEAEVRENREAIQNHRKEANEKEKELRSKESELRQAIRNARAASKPSDDEPPRSA